MRLGNTSTRQFAGEIWLPTFLSQGAINGSQQWGSGGFCLFFLLLRGEI